MQSALDLDGIASVLIDNFELQKVDGEDTVLSCLNSAAPCTHNGKEQSIIQTKLIDV